MKYSGNYKIFKQLFKYSKSFLSIEQLKCIAAYIYEEQKGEFDLIVFCHKDAFQKVRKNYIFRRIQKTKKTLLLFSPIIPDIDDYKHKRFFLFYFNKGIMSFESNAIQANKTHGIKKIISGGQTGADQAGLLAAAYLKIFTGGTAPLNFMTEDGMNTDLFHLFGLNESPFSNYKKRTEDNVIEGDGTILFGNQNTPGSKLTIKYCVIYNKPLLKIPYNESLFNSKLLIDVAGESQNEIKALMLEIRKWIIDNKIKVLNIAGNRNSINDKIGLFAFQILILSIGRNNEKNKIGIDLADIYNNMYSELLR